MLKVLDSAELMTLHIDRLFIIVELCKVEEADNEEDEKSVYKSRMPRYRALDVKHSIKRNKR